MDNNPLIIRSVQRAIDVLNCFGVKNKELTLTEISNETGLAKSTAIRVLATLEENNFLDKDSDSGKYCLGSQMYFLGYAAGKSISLKSAAKSAMCNLRKQVGETINLFVLRGDHRVCIQQYESLQSVKHMVQIGEELPITLGASGKVLLAFLPQTKIEELIQSQMMVKSQDQLLTELNSIRETHYAESIEEREKGTSAIASPIFGIDGEVIGALSISGPAHRFYPSEKAKEALLKTAIEISRNMGNL